MTSPDVLELIDRFGKADLSHVYDPVKAREYYLRTRQLKGRQKGAKDPDPTYKQSKLKPQSQRKPSARVSNKAKREAFKQETAERVARFKRRLERLEKVLDELVKQAKARSGVETETKKSSSTKTSSSSKSSSRDTKPKTAAQKREDAKKAAERRKKENPSGGKSEEKALEEKIHDVREKIKDMKAQIAAAKKKARSKKKPDAKSKTA